MHSFLQKIQIPFARFSLFLIYFWFGILKIFGESPANPLVAGLLEKTMPLMTFDTFIVFFGIGEMIIGTLFLIHRMDKISIPLFFLHMITTAMPLFLLPSMAWSGYFIPTLEGQYIIKNIALISLVFTIAASSNLHAHRSRDILE